MIKRAGICLAWFVSAVMAWSGVVLAGPAPEGDVDGDFQVGLGDLGVLAARWMETTTGCPEPGGADLEANSVVDFGDFVRIAREWGEKGSFLTNRVYPVDAGVVDVTKPPYHADNTGMADVTAILTEAASNNKIVYLPKGVYRVTDTVLVDGTYSDRQVHGQSTVGTIIKLDDHCPGYGSGSKPVVRVDPHGQDTFRRYVRHLTIDVGSGNPAARGLDFHANNNGAVTDVIIRSGDGQGDVGLNFSAAGNNGPLLAKNVMVFGFDVGVKSASGLLHGQTLSNILVRGQNEFGVKMIGQVFNIENLISDNTCPALRQTSGTLTLINGTLYGGAAEEAAIDISGGRSFVGNVRTCGYGQAIKNSAGDGEDVMGDAVTAFSTHEAVRLWPGAGMSLNLPIRETPIPSWDEDMGDWANVDDYGATPARVNKKDDDAPGVQAAIDSGKSTVYFPEGNGEYELESTVLIRGNVKRIVFFCRTGIKTVPGPGFRLVDSAGSPAVVELEMPNINANYDTPVLDNASSDRTLVVRFGRAVGGMYTGTGDCFFEDVVCGRLRNFVFKGGQNVWARHLNAESRNGQRHVVNEGGHLWILGYKTENAGILVDTSGGGLSEICGHFAYTGMMEWPYDVVPMYRCTDSSLSFTMSNAHYSTKNPPVVVVEETREGETRELLRADVGPHVPLFVGE